MAKLNKADADKAGKLARLLDEYVALADAIERIAHPVQYDFGVTVSDNNNDSNFLSVGLDRKIADIALRQQRTLIRASLAKLGVDVRG